MKFNTGGTGTKLFITSAGLVGIGTDDPDYQLNVVSPSGKSSIEIKSKGTGANDDVFLRMRPAGTSKDCWIDFGDDDDADIGGIRYNHSNDFMSFTTNTDERLRIDSNGKVCITHDSALHSGNLQVSTTGADAIDINSYSTSADNGGRLSFYRSKNASIGSNTIVADDDSLGRIDFRGYNTSGNSYNQGATIEAVVDGAVNSSTDMPSAILFKTSADGSANPDERLRIASGGEVSIGGFAPTAGAGILQISGGLRVAGSASASDTNTPYIYRTSGSDHLNFATSGSERIKILANGNVLCGGTAVSQTNRQLALGSNAEANLAIETHNNACLLYTSPSPRD